MAFLEQLGKKITEVGQSASKFSKEKSDLVKLNSQISAEEKNINVKYFSIGKLYVEKYSEGAEGELAQMVASIRESEKKISMYRSQIQDIKGVVRCDKCGTEVSKDVAYCSSCGSYISKNENVIQCANCGQVLSKDSKFCVSCGYQIPDVQQAAPQPEPQPEPQPAPQPAPQPVVSSPVEKTCPTCGAKLKDGDLFCTECGVKL